jgi:putative flavoprotein involved in K+ transport
MPGDPDRYPHRVVSGGNSAVQIAVELAAIARVSLATRTPLRWQNQRPLGRDIHWWLTRTSLDGTPLPPGWQPHQPIGHRLQ